MKMSSSKQENVQQISEELVENGAEQRRLSSSQDITQIDSKKTPSLRTMSLVKRRLSMWKQPKRGSVVSSSRNTAPEVKLENTYRTAPEPEKKFSVSKAKETIEECIKFYLQNQTIYNAKKSAQIVQLLSDDIKKKVRSLGYERYKLVVHVVMGQVCDQDIHVASRCLWDITTDDMATVTYSNNAFVATITIFATYFN